MAKFKIENTPNPNTIKINIDQMIYAGTIEYQRHIESNSEFANEIFQIDGIHTIFILKDFLTVSKDNTASFDTITEKVCELITRFINENKSFGDKPIEKSTANLSDLEKKIHEVLDKYIRPAVAQDGGDVSYQEFRDGTLYVKMSGSCHGCPSSVATLKGGIERLMLNMVPEVKSVEAV